LGALPAANIHGSRPARPAHARHRVPAALIRRCEPVPAALRRPRDGAPVVLLARRQRPGPRPVARRDARNVGADAAGRAGAAPAVLATARRPAARPRPPGLLEPPRTLVLLWRLRRGRSRAELARRPPHGRLRAAELRRAPRLLDRATGRPARRARPRHSRRRAPSADLGDPPVSRLVRRASLES